MMFSLLISVIGIGVSYIGTVWFESDDPACNSAGFMMMAIIGPVLAITGALSIAGVFS